MVTLGGVSRFYSRNSTGKYPLDIHDIRSAFALSEALPERLKSFRYGRLASIVAGETPVPLPLGGKLILHFVPIAALDISTRLEISPVTVRPLLARCAPIVGSDMDFRFNFDGVLAFNRSREGNYVQLFRSGSAEAVNSRILDLSRYGGNTPPHIPDSHFEKRIMESVTAFLDAYMGMGMGLPIFVLTTLLGVEGFGITSGPESFGQHVIDRDQLLLPDVMVDDPGFQVDKLLRPVFDTICQSAGLPGSPNYKEDGTWKSEELGNYL
jgi:hypothetical protein